MPAKQRASTPHDPTDTYEPEDDEHANDPLLVPEGEDFEFEFTFEEEAEAKAAFALPDAPETIPLDQKTINTALQEIAEGKITYTVKE